MPKKGNTKSNDDEADNKAIKSSAFFQKIQEEEKKEDLSEQEQLKLGQPLEDDKAVSDKHENYFKMVIKLIEHNEIDVFTPESLLHPDVYNALDDEAKGQVDLTTPNLCNYLQQIQTLWDKDHEQSYQMSNLIDSVWQTTEAIEKKYGDVYKI